MKRLVVALLLLAACSGDEEPPVGEAGSAGAAGAGAAGAAGAGVGAAGAGAGGAGAGGAVAGGAGAAGAAGAAGGSFACGSTTCLADEYCTAFKPDFHVTFTCRPLPKACESTQTCDCLKDTDAYCYFPGKQGTCSLVDGKIHLGC